MDILLTHGYYLNEDPREMAVMKPYPSLGVLYLSSYLKGRGFEVGVFDSTFSSPDAFQELVDRESPPVVGIYCNMLTRRRVLDMVQICKRRGAVVVLGGPDPTNYPEEYLSRGVDVVVVGEGELTLEELLRHLGAHGRSELDRISGIAHLDAGGRLARTDSRPHIPDLDALPEPDRPEADLPRYTAAWREAHGYSSLSLITSRGCAYSCAWCSHAVFGNTHRRRSPARVADELQSLVAAYNPDAVWYADDVFTLNRRWLLSYSEELKMRGLRVPFECVSREDRLDREIVQCLAETGCRRLWLGAESGSQRVLDAMNRRTDAARTREMARLLREHGIEVGMFIMLGYEGEEMADLHSTVQHLKEANPHSFLSTLAYPIKGTPYYEKVADRAIALKPWPEGSDRDLTVAGRRSRRFYSFANRWITGEVNLHRELRAERRDYPRLARALANVGVGRVGMTLTSRETERGNHNR